MTPDGKLLLSADRDSDAISIVDVASRKVLASIPVGKRPFGITIDMRGERAYTANVKSDDATVIDIAARKVVGSVKTGRRPYAVALAQGKGFVTDQYGGTVTVFDLATLAPVKRIDTCDHAEGIEADAGEKMFTSRAGAKTFCFASILKLAVTGRGQPLTGRAPSVSFFVKFCRVTGL
ncbi:YncE family protein [Bradyrhizobium sp. RDI18]|uniref:YncE family protein n=1 Tax=Bradyrhizobium sp. RDI18 TaxID=3367400 RepID=UPI00371D8192